MEEKRKIKFIERHEVKDKSGIVFEAGQIEEMSIASCEHFINRGKAIYYTEPAPEKYMEEKSDPVTGVHRKTLQQKGK